MRDVVVVVVVGFMKQLFFVLFFSRFFFLSVYIYPMLIVEDGNLYMDHVCRVYVKLFFLLCFLLSALNLQKVKHCNTTKKGKQNKEKEKSRINKRKCVKYGSSRKKKIML